MVLSAYFHLWRIAQLHPYLDVGALTTLIHALVISRLDYCNALYVGLPFEAEAEASNGALCGGQTSQWDEKISAYFLHSGCPTLSAVNFHIDFKVLMMT